MRSGDVRRRDVVRSLLTMVKNEAIAQKVDAAKLTDDAIIAVLKRAQKQRADAAQQFRAGNRPELADKEAAEAEIIAAYLPEQMSEEQIAEIVDAVIARVGTENFGAVMGQVMAHVKGQADGATVKAIVEAKLAAQNGA